MRRSERAAQLSRCAARVFDGARTLIAVDVDTDVAGATITRLAHAHELAHHAGSYEGALLAVAPSTELASLLLLVRPLLRDGAKLLLVAPAGPGARARLSALVTRTPAPRVALETLCEGLLRVGLGTPRVHGDVAGCLLVSAELPARREALDVFFAQPSDPTRR